MKRIGGRAARRFLEDLAELGFALAVELPHDLRAVQVNEVHAAFGGDRAGQQRLARALAVRKQHALRRENAQPLEDAGVLQRELDDLADPCDLAFKPADVLIRHCRSACSGLLAFDDPDVRPLPDDDRAGRNRADDLKIHRLGERRYPYRGPYDHGNAFEILQHPFGRNDRGRSTHPERSEANGHGLIGLDHGHRDLFLESRAAITARRPIDLDDALVFVVGELGARHGARAARDLQHVARLRAKPHKVRRCDAGDGVADVFDPRLRDSQRKGDSHDRWRRFRRAVIVRRSTHPCT